MFLVVENPMSARFSKRHCRRRYYFARLDKTEGRRNSSGRLTCWLAESFPHIAPRHAAAAGPKEGPFESLARHNVVVCEKMVKTPLEFLSTLLPCGDFCPCSIFCRRRLSRSATKNIHFTFWPPSTDKEWRIITRGSRLRG